MRCGLVLRTAGGVIVELHPPDQTNKTSFGREIGVQVAITGCKLTGSPLTCVPVAATYNLPDSQLNRLRPAPQLSSPHALHVPGVMSPLYPPGIYSTPIKDRPSPSIQPKLRAIAINFGFFTAAVTIHLVQLFLLPLAIVPGDGRRLLRAGLRFTKDAVEAILRATNQFAGPSKFLLSTDQTVSLSEVAELDETGRVVRLKLAQQSGKLKLDHVHLGQANVSRGHRVDSAYY